MKKFLCAIENMKMFLICWMCISVLMCWSTAEAIDCSGTGLQDELDKLSGDGTTITCNSGTITFPAGGIDVDQGYAVKIDGGGVVVSSGGGIHIKGTPGKIVEITGFTFGNGTTYPGSADYNLCINYSGNNSSCGLSDCNDIVKIHGNTFHGNSTAGPEIYINDMVTGVIYNNTFQGPRPWSMIDVSPEIVNTSKSYYSAAGYNWSQDTNLGGSNFVFIEGNTVNIDVHGAGNAFVDGNYGGRWVERFNTLKNANLGRHDSSNYNSGEGAHQGVRAIETYNNDMHYDVGYYHGMSNARGGAGVMFNNRLRTPKSGSDRYCSLYAYRSPTTIIGVYTLKTDLVTSSAEDAGGVEVTSESAAFDSGDIGDYLYITGGTGWTVGQWCQISGVVDSTATLACTDVSIGSNSGALSDGTFILSNSNINTWHTLCGDALAEKMCMFSGELCTGDGNGDCTSHCGDGSDNCGPCVPVDTPVDGRTYPLCRSQIGSGKHNESTGAQAVEPFYAWDNYYCASPASYNLNSPDGDEVPCRVKMGSTSFPTSPVTSVGKKLTVNGKGTFTGGTYIISAVDGDGYGLLSQDGVDVACSTTDGATGNADYQFDLYASAEDCQSWRELSYSDMVATQSTILSTDFVVQSAAPETYTPADCPHTLAAASYPGKKCDYTLYGTAGYGTKASSSGSTANFGSGSTHSWGSGATHTFQ